MEIRRIVTGHDGQGNAFVFNAQAPRVVAFKNIPGHAFALVWATKANATRLQRQRDEFGR